MHVIACVPMLIVGAVDPVVAEHLKKALASHLQWCRANGVVVPGDVADLFQLVATGGQRRPTLAVPSDALHDGGVLLLTLTYDQVARSLNVSARSVRRLVAAGTLASVDVCSAPRVRVADLVKYVERLELR